MRTSALSASGKFIVQEGGKTTLRYPFNASPVVPTTPIRSGWKWHLLTDLARLATGHTPSRRCPEYWKGDIPWIQLPDIRALDGQFATDTSEHTNNLGIANSAAVLLPAGTVCLSRTASVGFVTVMSRPMATSQDFVNWICGPDLHPEFLMHLFIACRGPIRDLGSGAVHHTIYFPTVEAFSICIPPRGEQERIATSLTTALAIVDKARRAAQERLAAAEALPAVYLREVFDGPEASEWETRQLRDVSEICSGITLGRRQGLAQTHRVPYLRVANVKDGYLDLTDVYDIEATQSEIDALRLRRGDLLLTEGGDRDKLGRGTFWEEQLPLCLHQNHIFRVRLSQAYCPRFVSMQIGSTYGKSYFLRHAKQTTGIATINQGVLGNFPLLSPIFTDQLHIAARINNRLEAAEALIAHCREELEAIEALPAALLRQAFDESDE
jgi:type I restriction enzyme S subunit